jgi:hypothetical protein
MCCPSEREFLKTTPLELKRCTPMFTRANMSGLLLTVFWCTCSLAQHDPAVSGSPAVREFPVVLQQSVESGKTPIGTKIQAKLTIATLVDRVVIPKDAIFSGVVIESLAKTGKGPSRLAIRLESVQWKDGSASIKAYLTAWYYPRTVDVGPDLKYGPPEPASKTWDGAGQYPSADSRVYRPFPGNDSDKNSGVIPNTTSSVTSNNPVLMKNVALAPTTDGGIALVSERANLKLDKLTTYVVAAASP